MTETRLKNNIKEWIKELEACPYALRYACAYNVLMRMKAEVEEPLLGDER